MSPCRRRQRFRDLVRAAGLEPAQALRPHGFSYHFGFRRRPPGVRGLDYPFTLAFVRCRCCPSSLYTFPLTEAWLGIASEGFPDFEQFCSQGFPQGTQWLKSDASTSSATPASAHLYGANSLRQREYSCFRIRFEHWIGLLDRPVVAIPASADRSRHGSLNPDICCCFRHSQFTGTIHPAWLLRFHVSCAAPSRCWHRLRLALRCPAAPA